MLDSLFKDLKFTVDISIKFRWLVATGVFMIPAVFGLLKMPVKALPIYITAIVIIFYNTFFSIILSKQRKPDKNTSSERKHAIYRNIGRAQIVLDYITLVLVLFFVGGLHTNFFFILLFHLTIGAIMLSTQFMYLMVMFTTISFFFISLLQLYNTIPHFDMYNNVITFKSITIETIGNALILASVVFVVSQLTFRIKSSNTKLLNTQNKLKSNLEQIRALELRKSKFMRYSAHQLRSPLATIISALNVIQKKMIPLDSDRAFNLATGAYDKGNELLNLVNDLLELSRIRENKKEIALVDDINPIPIIEDIIFSLNETVYAKKLTIKRNYILDGQKYSFALNYRYDEDFEKHKFNLPKDTIPHADPKHLKDAFYNLIENAIKYSYDNAEIILDFSFDNTNRVYVFRIQDFGIGIDPEYKNDIFFEFVRSPNAKDYKQEGTGLGLAIVKEILDAHNADIFVESEPGKGSIFTVVFHDYKGSRIAGLLTDFDV